MNFLKANEYDVDCSDIVALIVNGDIDLHPTLAGFSAGIQPVIDHCIDVFFLTALA